ncbi:hypothetical protein H4219_001497 [Mycoemilia scoparia]|uniref:Uncharacterized protein n=1 Tax=Mycoemilia scoparia TaxID=417184 RepID=A0A9W8A6F1_9FUNG|nr:hypothetical protein H4219_001497 [Mycoemilia scoparia]
MSSGSEKIAAQMQAPTTLGKFGLSSDWLINGYPDLLSYEWWGGPGGLFPIGVFMTLHAVRIAYDVRKVIDQTGRTNIFQEVFCMLAFSFGGTIITALMLGRPQPILESNLLIPVYAGAYILMSRLPGDGLYRLCRMTSPLSDVLLATVDGLLRGYGVTASGVDMVRLTLAGTPISNSLVGWIAIGTIGGCGGGIIDDFIQISKPQWGLRTPTMFRNPSFDFLICLGTTLSYIITTRIWKFSERLPDFPFSNLVDWIIDFAPHFSVEEARVVCSLVCAVLLGYRGYTSALKFNAQEKAKAKLAASKKDDDLSEKEESSKDS